MDSKKIVISNVTCKEQVQFSTLFVSSNLAHIVQLHWPSEFYFITRNLLLKDWYYTFSL